MIFLFGVRGRIIFCRKSLGEDRAGGCAAGWSNVSAFGENWFLNYVRGKKRQNEKEENRRQRHCNVGKVRAQNRHEKQEKREGKKR